MYIIMIKMVEIKYIRKDDIGCMRTNAQQATIDIKVNITIIEPLGDLLKYTERSLDLSIQA